MGVVGVSVNGPGGGGGFQELFKERVVMVGSRGGGRGEGEGGVKRSSSY